MGDRRESLRGKSVLVILGPFLTSLSTISWRVQLHVVIRATQKGLRSTGQEKLA